MSRIVRAPKLRSELLKLQTDERLQEKMADAFVENFDDIVFAVRNLYDFGKTGTTHKHGSATCLSIMVSIGCRKIELLDSICQFYTYNDWKKK